MSDDIVCATSCAPEMDPLKAEFNADFSVDGGINYTCSTTGISIVWADNMSRITIPYFQIYCPDGYTISSFTFDGSPVSFSMSASVNIFDGRSVSSSPIMEITPTCLI